MKTSKKLIFSLTPIVLGMGALVAIGVVNPMVLSTNADVEYKLVFNKNHNINPDITLVQPEIPEGNNDPILYVGQYDHMPVTTDGGYKGLDFFFEGAFTNPNGYVTLGYDGSFGNTYLKQHENHGRINGLKSIKVTYTGVPLIVNYSFEEQMKNNDYRVTNQLIESGVEYNFDNTYPQYFKVQKTFNGFTNIEEIIVTYTCNTKNMQEPTQPYYDSGFHVGSIHGDEAFTATAKNANEAHLLVEKASALHYRYADITFDFDVPKDETPYKFSNARSNAFHNWFFYIGEGDQFVSHGVNKFQILYFGETGFNNDVFSENPQPDLDPNEIGLENSANVAQIHMPITEPVHFFTNAHSKIRQDYAKANNLVRPADYNDFAIDKLPKEKELDVYNSEDLWWAVLNGYKPVFPLVNSKAEWIYNQAKEVVKTVINDSMTNLEKARALYEWIIDNTTYDNDALNEGTSEFENVCFYLEGVFERHIAVCDGFSKAFTLMGKIEGLDVIRGCGFDPDGSGEGHAWNYFRENENQKYHLVCPTWGQLKTHLHPTQDTSMLIDLSYYDAFMAPKSYFSDAYGTTKPVYIDYLTELQPLAPTVYEPDVLSLDKLPDAPQYDYHINNEEELNAVIDKVIQACPEQNFTFSLTLEDAVLPTYNAALSKIGSNNYFVYNLDLNDQDNIVPTYGRNTIRLLCYYKGPQNLN